MSKIDTLLPAEITQFSSENVRQAAEKGVGQAREAYDKLNASAKDAAGSFNASAIVFARGVSEFNVKAFEAFRANTGAAFDLLISLAAVKSPTKIVALQADFAEKQLKALNQQANDLTVLARKIATDCVEPIKGQLEKSFKSVG